MLVAPVILVALVLRVLLFLSIRRVLVPLDERSRVRG